MNQVIKEEENLKSHNFIHKKRDFILTANDEIHFLNITLLKKFLTFGNRIYHRRVTKLSKKKFDKLVKAIKIARYLGLLGFIN